MPTAFSVLGGISCPHTQKKTQDPKKLGNIRKMPKLRRIIAQFPVFLPNSKFCQYQQKPSLKQISNFSLSVLFHMKTKVCLKYFVRGCSIVTKFIITFGRSLFTPFGNILFSFREKVNFFFHCYYHHCNYHCDYFIIDIIIILLQFAFYELLLIQSLVIKSTFSLILFILG